ncbi:MAG: glycosyltransferase [Frankiaceae bacterium]
MYGLLLLGWAATAYGISSDNGQFSVVALTFVTAGAGAVGATAWRALRHAPGAPAPRVRDRPSGAALGWAVRLLPLGLAAAMFVVVLAPFRWLRPFLASGTALTVSRVLMALAAVLAAATALPLLDALTRAIGRDRPSGALWSQAVRRLDLLAAAPWAFWAVLALAASAAAAMVVATPEPRIDVFYLLQGSADGLLHGADMYQQSWAPIPELYRSDGLFAVYPYLPATSVLVLPARIVFGDVRYAEIAALVFAAVTLRRLLPRRFPGLPPGVAVGAAAGVPALLPLLVLVFPRMTYSIQQAWTEPLLAAALVGMVWAVCTGRMRLSVVFLAVALASKQHVFLLLPLAACWPAFGWRRALAAAGSAVLFVLPWVLAGPEDFWHDAVSVNLGYDVLTYGLDWPAVAARHGWGVGFGLTALGLLGAYAVALRLRRSAFGFCLGGALVVYTLNLTNKQSFFNHYTLGMALVVLAVVVGLREDAGERTA